MRRPGQFPLEKAARLRFEEPMWMSRLRKDRWLVCIVLVSCIIAALAGCGKKAGTIPNVVMSHEIAPLPPKVGPAKITVSLTDAAGRPIAGAHVSLEGYMTHPGMRPVFGEAGEVGSGRYQAPIQFTMGGDWVILVRINLPDGHKFEREFEVKGVQPG
jgi:YtkA-like protein